MVSIHIMEGNQLALINEPQNNSWIQLVSPTAQEIDDIIIETKIDKKYFTDNSSDEIVTVTYLNIQEVKYRLILSSEYVITISTDETANESSDNILRQFIKIVLSLPSQNNYIDIDIEDIQSVMAISENTYILVGDIKGVNTIDDADEIFSSPVISNARNIFMAISISQNVELADIDKLTNIISKKKHPDGDLVFCATPDESLDDEMKILLMVSGE